MGLPLREKAQLEGAQKNPRIPTFYGQIPTFYRQIPTFLPTFFLN